MSEQRQLITPEIASRMLDCNTHNRPLKRANLAFLVAEMEAGRWEYNGETIKIAADGTILDGQHRLLAVVETGISIESLVVTDLASNVFGTIDVGASRSAGDTLSVAGEANGRNLASALVVADELLQGKTDFTRHTKVSNIEILRMLNDHSEIKNSMVWGKRLVHFAPYSVTVSLHYLFSKTNSKRADLFFDGLHTGIGLDSNSPVYLLRQRLIDNATSKGKMTRRYMSALFIKAWNAYLSSRKLKYIRFRETGDAPELFPSFLCS